jgi:hypothetical protein
VPDKAAFIVYWKYVKWEMYNNCHFYVKLAPEFFDAKLIICITFTDKSVEGSMQALKFCHGY